MNFFKKNRIVLALLALGLASCGGGISNSPCVGQCGTDAPQRLEVVDVQKIIAQAVAEAQARNASGTIAVVDRVGNVLGVFRMNGSDQGIVVAQEQSQKGGLEGIDVIPDSLAAIAKAITGAYLSSEGNAFSTRTAGQIVQENFNPGERDQPAGPLFGVQFSQLPCSDLSQRVGAVRPAVGPQRSPLGLAADPGGFPLYKNGVAVGGIGVIADGLYALDKNISNTDQDLDELLALAGTVGYDAPADRRGDRITVDAKTFRYSDATRSDLRANPNSAPDFIALNGSAGNLIAVTGYTPPGDASIVRGTAFGTPESGIRPASQASLAVLDGFVLVDNNNVERYPPVNGSDASTIGAGMVLQSSEVTVLLEEALKIANRARAQIRRPLSTPVRVTISVIDTFGNVLGIVRTRDAPVFGTDVSLQKARSVAFFSNPAAAGDLLATPATKYLATNQEASIADYVPRFRSFLQQPNALADGAFAYGDRSVGNLARPFFPDGIRFQPHGPLSKPIAEWSPFNTGLQLDLINTAVLTHVVFTLGGGPDVARGACTQMPPPAGGNSRLANGLQIFAGGVPLYRGGQLVGAIGISGDGIDQDDMVAFLGTHNASLRLNNALGNAPTAMRADNISRDGVFLRYVQCPQAPFIGSDEQNVCQGK